MGRLPREIALASVYFALPRIVAEPRLAGCPFDREPIEKIILGVCLKGTASQKSALVKYLPAETGFAFPEIVSIFSGDVEKWEKGISFVTANVERLAGFFGCQPPQDCRELAEHVLDNFGGLSPVDFIRFFEQCREGRFRTEYQNVSVRGITAEFVLDWLRKFTEKNESVYLSLVNSAAENARGGNDEYRQSGEATDIGGAIESGLVAGVTERAKARAAEISEMEYRAAQRREDWERSLTENALVEYWTKPVQVETTIDTESGTRKVMQTVWLPCSETDSERKQREVSPYSKDKPKAAYRRLFRFIETYVNPKEAKGAVDALVEDWKNEHAKSPGEIAFEDFARNRANAFVNTGRKLIKEVSPGELIRNAMSKRHGKPGHEFLNVSRNITERIVEAWPEYLRQCLSDPETVPLKKDEYILQQTIVWLQDNELEYPFLSV